MIPRTRALHGAALAVAAFLVLTVVAGWAGLQTAMAPAASAHDFLVKTIPAEGGTVDRVPALVRLVFDQPVQKVGTRLVVTGSGGPVQQGAPDLVDHQVRQPITPGAPAGRYTVSWRVTSADGHPVSGSFSFTARAAGAGARPTSTKSGSAGSAEAATGQSNSLSTLALAWGGGVGLLILLAVVGWRVRRRI